MDTKPEEAVLETTEASRRAAGQGYTSEEQRNIDLVREYMEISYTPGRASARAVEHLCAVGNRFVAPTTFPGVHTLEAYAEDHGRIMEQVNDLHIVSFDVLFAMGDRVCLRYSAEGAHRGAPHGDIEPTGRTARWSAAALFRAEDGKLTEFIKDWNKLSTSYGCGSSSAGRYRSASPRADPGHYCMSTDFPVAAAYPAR